MSGLIGVILFALAIAVAVLVAIFVLVPIIKGIIWLISNLFKGIGWVIQHIFSFVFGTIGDVIRLFGSVLAMVVLSPMVPLNVILGRWSAAGHFAESIKRECRVFGLCIYRIVLQRPLRLVLLDGLLEGVEKRVPEAMAAAPTSDKPSRRTGTFDGYTIVGSLRGGGSGAKLYIAQPTGTGRTARLKLPDRVVIKSFALTDGSSLPQIVRESRALEAARKLGLVLDHDLNDHRFWYVMPYHSGNNLGVVTRQLHAESSERGLTQAQLPKAMGLVHDLLQTVSSYHREGLWHKDIKPENIIINEDSAHLVDLGLVTPLHSAMTLTTHGTEYFRDPEMVRLALRGVKVHQVDGTKFDIFAIGAVLYFMLENTFPAHGGLSRFSRRSPEALRWIVRRSMADYNKRYESVQVLLADMNVAMAADDPFTVKPIDLPSMNGQTAASFEDDESETEGEQFADVMTAGSPIPPQDNHDQPQGFKGIGLAAGFGSDGPFAQVGQMSFDADGEPVGKPAAPARPRLTLTNWWTGRYAVDFAATGKVAQAAAPKPQQVFEQARETVRSSAHQARRAAREQVRDARARAKAMRQRVSTRRRGAIAERQPGPWVVLTSIIVLGVLALLVVGLVRATNPSSYSQLRGDAVATSDLGPTLLVINDVEDDGDQTTRDRIDEVLNTWQKKGYDVVADDEHARSVITDLYHRWQEDSNGQADDDIENALETFNYYGILHITQTDSGIDGSRIHSTRAGAKDRRRMIAESSLPVLLINDHPDANDVEIIDWIDAELSEKRSEGYEIATRDILAEATLQPYLELWKTEGAEAVGEELAQELMDLGYSGVLYMTEGQSFGTANQRVNELFFYSQSRTNMPADQSHVSVNGATATSTSQKREIAPNAPDITSAIMVSNSIRPIVASKNLLPTGLEVEGNFFTTTRGQRIAFKHDGRRPTRSLRINSFYAPAGTRIVQVRVDHQSPANIFAKPLLKRIDDKSQIALVDAEGNSYSPVGYVHVPEDDMPVIMLDPKRFVATLDKLTLLPEGSLDEMRLIFRVTIGAEIRKLVFGNETVGVCSIVVEPK